MPKADTMRARRKRARTRVRRRPSTARPTLPRAAELRYFKALRRVVRKLHKLVQQQVVPLLRDGPIIRTDAVVGRIKRKLHTIEVEIGELVSDIAFESELAAVAASTSAHNVGIVRRALGIAITGDDPAIAQALPRFLRTNVSLVQKMATRQLRSVERVIEEGANRGVSVADIAANLTERLGIDERRAKLIARDQVLTLNQQLTQKRHENIGITHYFWSTSQDEKVRGSEESDTQDHVSLNGRRFAYANPPADPRDGEPAHPGGRINCRCVAIPDTAALLDPDASA